jgi:hypothetical protein
MTDDETQERVKINRKALLIAACTIVPFVPLILISGPVHY